MCFCFCFGGLLSICMHCDWCEGGGKRKGFITIHPSIHPSIHPFTHHTTLTACSGTPPGRAGRRQQLGGGHVDDAPRLAEGGGVLLVRVRMCGARVGVSVCGIDKDGSERVCMSVYGKGRIRRDPCMIDTRKLASAAASTARGLQENL